MDEDKKEGCEVPFDVRRDGREGMVTVVNYEGRIVGSMGVETWQRVLELSQLYEKLVAFRTEYLTTCREWHGMSEHEAAECLADFESEWDRDDAN